MTVRLLMLSKNNFVILLLFINEQSKISESSKLVGMATGQHLKWPKVPFSFDFLDFNLMDKFNIQMSYFYFLLKKGRLYKHVILYIILYNFKVALYPKYSNKQISVTVF